ncbi:MAG: alpha/beta fold hydrolase [Proteobacteria bacterium]|jgi:triacylglycerol lipase|nr:alpha/beta fold hydrolase [Pseudomonadota bacterium]
MMNVRRMTALAVTLLTVSLLSPVRAEVLVLVHGWAANADSWVQSGALPTLESRGWHPAGVVSAGPQGIIYLPAPGQTAGRKVYRVNLPAEAPLQLQAAYLFAELEFLRRRHPADKFYLVGHSAGGVVARLVVVQSNASLDINRLVTIAAPNLGTGRAIQGLDIADSKPFFCPGPGVDFLKSMVGGDDYEYLKVSRGALVDLSPAAIPGSLIGWLNRQPHPDISYTAIVREYDDIVPPVSQDLNQVPALRGQAQIYVVNAAHTLNPADGALLADILAQD